MSADSFIAYFGLRFEIYDTEVESVELRSDRRMRAARSELGILGAENDVETSIAADDMRKRMTRG